MTDVHEPFVRSYDMRTGSKNFKNRKNLVLKS